MSVIMSASELSKTWKDSAGADVSTMPVSVACRSVVGLRNCGPEIAQFGDSLTCHIQLSSVIEKMDWLPDGDRTYRISKGSSFRIILALKWTINNFCSIGNHACLEAWPYVLSFGTSNSIIYYIRWQQKTNQEFFSLSVWKIVRLVILNFLYTIVLWVEVRSSWSDQQHCWHQYAFCS